MRTHKVVQAKSNVLYTRNCVYIVKIFKLNDFIISDTNMFEFISSTICYTISLDKIMFAKTLK